MKLFFITEARFYQTAKKEFFAGEFSFSNVLWDRYNSEFEEVYVLGRVFSVEKFDNAQHLISNVNILPMFPFDSIFDFLKNKSIIRKTISNYFATYKPNVVIIRGAGAFAYEVVNYCIRNKISYGIEVIGDPYEVFSKGGVRHPLRKFLRYLFTKYQKKAVYYANSVIYVTKETLQRRYPSNYKAFITYASDVFIEQPITTVKTINFRFPIKLISVGSLEQMYKSPDTLLRALSKLIHQGVNLELIWLGHGKFMKEMISLSEQLDISSKVKFLGSVSSEEVVHYLDQSDIFLLVSRTEGLPKAMVEAMSRALPCIGTNVGGIPELVHPNLLINVGDVDSLVNKILYVIDSQERYKRYSAYSIDVASQFTFQKLNMNRSLFFESLKQGCGN